MASKKALMIQRTEEYLELHRGDPAAYPMTVEAVAAFIPVARRLFYKNDPDIEALLSRIRSAEALPSSAAGRSPDRDDGASLDDAALERAIGQVVIRSVWAMQKFIGHHKGTRAAVEAALAAHDLDELLGTLAGCQQSLRALAKEYERRRRSTAGSSDECTAQASLFDG